MELFQEIITRFTSWRLRVIDIARHSQNRIERSICIFSHIEEAQVSCQAAVLGRTKISFDVAICKEYAQVKVTHARCAVCKALAETVPLVWSAAIRANRRKCVPLAIFTQMALGSAVGSNLPVFVTFRLFHTIDTFSRSSLCICLQHIRVLKEQRFHIFEQLGETLQLVDINI